MRNISILFIALLFAVTAACTPSPIRSPISTPEPTPDALATETRIAANIYATQTARVPTTTNTATNTLTATPTRTETITRTPTRTNTPQPSKSPLPPPTSLPTTTALPTNLRAGVPADWKTFQGGGVEFALPNSFVGGDIQKDLPLIVARLRELGPNFQKMADALEKNSTSIKIWVFDSHVGSSGSLTNVSVANEKVLSFVTVEIYLEAVTRQLPPEIHIVEKKTLEIGPYPAARIVAESSVGTAKVKQGMYMIRGEDAFWVVSYSTAADEWDERLPLFEQSIQTFRILP